MGRKVKILSYPHGQYFSVFMTDVDARNRLSALMSELARHGLADAEVSHKNNLLSISISSKNETLDEDESERVVSILGGLFPILAEADQIVVDEILGELRWDDELSQFEGSISLDCEKTDLFIEIPPAMLCEESLRLPRQVVAFWPQWKATISSAILTELFTNYDTGWKAHDAGALASGSLTETAFLDRIAPTTLTLHADNSCSLHYFADGLFQDHGIRVDLTDNGVSLIVIE